jgi:glycosyltransferase involved in cell wall biosynthesis
MKIIVQLPVFNEEKNLVAVINDIKSNSELGQFSSAGLVVINDGSTDNSLEIARGMGITDIVDLKKHCGLGVAFKEGLRYAIKLGADIIVNTDADFQYRASDMHKLLTPILDNKADMVIGDRQIARLNNYPRYKYISQSLGNLIISRLFKADAKDATSGFRALSRDAAEVLIESMGNPYTYTVESICILLKKNKRIAFVPIRINSSLRKSRLIRSKSYYCFNYLFTAFRYYLRRDQ